METHRVDRHRGSRIFHTTGPGMLVMLALRTGQPLLHTEIRLVLISVRGCVDPHRRTAAGRIESIEKKN
jgi:hypothetical protein